MALVLTRRHELSLAEEESLKVSFFCFFMPLKSWKRGMMIDWGRRETMINSEKPMSKLEKEGLY